MAERFRRGGAGRQNGTPSPLGDEQYAEVKPGYAMVQVRVRNVITSTAVASKNDPTDVSLAGCVELTRIMVDRVQKQVG